MDFNYYFSDQAISLANLEEGYARGNSNHVDDTSSPQISAVTIGPVADSKLQHPGPLFSSQPLASQLEKSQPSAFKLKGASDSSNSTTSDASDQTGASPRVRFNPAHSPREDKSKSIKRPNRRRKLFREYTLGTMPGWERKLNGMETFMGAVLRFWDSLLRGIGQVLILILIYFFFL
jgi:hypothetical protein